MKYVLPIRNITANMSLLIILVALPPSSAFSATSLWQVSKNNNTLYIGGTIHVLKKEDYPLPPEFDLAFEKADTLVVETNIDDSRTAVFQKKMLGLLSYDSVVSLKDHLDATTFAELSRYFSSRGLSINRFLTVKPVMVVLTLTMMELARIGMTGVGVDEYFYRKAQVAGKTMEYFETAEQQLHFIVNMGAGHESELVQQTLDEVAGMESIINDMKSAWLSGNESKLADVTIADMRRNYPQIYQSLLVQRNKNWMPTIEKMLSDENVELILVGALHLVGTDGLLRRLRDKGYRVVPF